MWKCELWQARKILKKMHDIELAARRAMATQSDESSVESDSNDVQDKDLIEIAGNCPKLSSKEMGEIDPITIPHHGPEVVQKDPPSSNFFPCTLKLPSEFSGIFETRIEHMFMGGGSQQLALEYHPDGDIAVKSAIPGVKKKRWLRGKKGSK